MSLKAQTIINHIEELAPVSLAYTWDNVGLIVGEPGADVKNILISLNLNHQVIEEAVQKDVNMIITHHPLLLKPISTLRSDLPKGSLLTRLITSKMTLYTAHTNLDIAQDGVNDAFAEALSLQKVKVLQVTQRESLEKLVVFVPPTHLAEVRNAICEAGAGWIGNYSHCTFQTPGTGTFLPREGTNPHIGSPGSLEKVAEERLETILPGYLRSKVLAALFKAHPYEEVAFDLYPLLNTGNPQGVGRVGELNVSMTLRELALLLKEVLGVSTLRVVGDEKRMIKKLALCGGSGGDLIKHAHGCGADALVTGDVKYHQAEEALALGMAVIDAGHDATERLIIPRLASYLQKRIGDAGSKNQVYTSRIETAYWKHV